MPAISRALAVAGLLVVGAGLGTGCDATATEPAAVGAPISTGSEPRSGILASTHPHTTAPTVPAEVFSRRSIRVARASLDNGIARLDLWGPRGATFQWRSTANPAPVAGAPCTTVSTTPGATAPEHLPASSHQHYVLECRAVPVATSVVLLTTITAAPFTYEFEKRVSIPI